MNARKLTRREMLKLSGTAVAGALLAACGAAAPAPAPAPTQAAAKAAEPTKAPAAATAVPAAAGAQRVELWTGFGQGRMADAMTGAVKRFNEKQTKFAAEHVIVPWQDIRNKVIAATAAKSPPDVYRGWAWIVGDDAPIGGLTDLTPFVEKTTDFNAADYWPPTLEQMKYGGKYYAMSISTIIDFIFWNKDRLKEKGIDPDNVPTDLEGWEAIGEKLYELNGKKIEKIGFNPLIPAKYLVAWAATRGAELWDPNTQKCIANDAKNKPIFVDLFKWYKKYTDKYGAEEVQAYITSFQGNSFGRNTPEGVYYTGRLAIWPIESWLYNDMKEYGPKVNFGWAKKPMPKGVTGRPGTLTANMYLVPAGAKSTEGGFSFAHFMGSDPWVAVNKCIPDAVMPSRKSNATLKEVLEGLPFAKMALEEILPKALPLPPMPSVSTYTGKLEQAVDAVLWNNADPAQALDDAVKAAQLDVDKKLKKS